MKFQKKQIVTALTHALAAAALVGGAPALAQDVTTPTPSSQTIKVDVVGSSIKRSLEDQSLPVQVITRDDIARSGVTNMEQLMQKISATSSAGGLSGGTLSGVSTYGQSAVSLRGLGAVRTLILLDGLRVTPFAQEAATGVDINSIPISAIERVEVLTEGASSIYGSDAVAGVINFVLRRNFTGATVGYEYDWPTRAGGGSTSNVWGSIGFGDLSTDKFNVTASFQSKFERALVGGQRDFSISGNIDPYYSNAATPSGRIEGIWHPGAPNWPSSAAGQAKSSSNPYGYTTGGYGNPGYDSPGCAAMGMFNAGKSGNSTGFNCNFDSAPFADLIPEIKTTSGVGTFNWMLTPQAELYGTALYTKNEITNTIQPNPARGSFFNTDTAFQGTNVDGALLIYPQNPNYPHAWLQSHGLAAMDGQPLAVTSRTFAAGGRQEFDTNTQQNYVVGLKGTWLKDWDYDVNAQWSQSQSDGTVTGGYFSQLAFADAWNTVGNTPGSYVDPWSVGGIQNPTLTKALQAANYQGPTASAQEKLSSFNAKTSGNIYDLSGGPLAMAAGFTYMKQKYNIVVPDILSQGDIAGLGGATLTQNGDRNVTSGYLEFNMPFTKTINTVLSGRVDHYSDLASDATPITGQLSATWQAWDWGMFRGSFGNGFRAPSMGEIHKPATLGTSEQFIDPLFADQGPIQVNAVTGGNPLLKPEKSIQGDVGFVWTPVRNFSTRVDWWYIQIKDYITTPSALAMVNAARAGTYIFSPHEVIFAPDGEVDTVNELLQNAGKATFSGLDGAVNWRQPSDWGTWGIDWTGTYYLKADLGTLIGTEHNIGTMVDPNTLNPLTIPITGGVIVRYKQNITLLWNYGPWGATLTNNYTTGYETGARQVTGDANFVPSFSTWDIQGTYSGLQHTQFVIGLKNLLDKNPPCCFVPTANQFQYGYDVSMYDARARVLYGRVVVSF